MDEVEFVRENPLVFGIIDFKPTIRGDTSGGGGGDVNTWEEYGEREGEREGEGVEERKRNCQFVLIWLNRAEVRSKNFGVWVLVG